ncbi:hypothetical protein OROMI_009766 [Orobanche minor]
MARTKQTARRSTDDQASQAVGHKSRQKIRTGHRWSEKPHRFYFRLFFNFTCKPTLPQTVHLLHVFQHNPENQAQGKGDAHCKNTNSFSTTIITSCR